MDKHSIFVLNSLLVAEQSVVKIYTKIIERMPSASITMELNELRQTHSRTVERLRRRLRTFDAADQHGKSAFSIPAMSGILSESIALSLLAQTEANALQAYEAHLDELDSHARSFVLRELLPQQEAAESVVATLNSVAELEAKTA
jgi:rubrerythrin